MKSTDSTSDGGIVTKTVRDWKYRLQCDYTPELVGLVFDASGNKYRWELTYGTMIHGMPSREFHQGEEDTVELAKKECDKKADEVIREWRL